MKNMGIHNNIKAQLTLYIFLNILYVSEYALQPFPFYLLITMCN